MAKISENEKILFTINENTRSKSSQINRNHKTYKSEELDDMLHRLERTRDRRNALDDTSTNTNTSCQKYCYHQLAERVREWGKEIVPDRCFYQIPPVYSPFSAITPSSNVSGGGFSNYSRSQNFPINLLSPNSTVPMQRFGLSSRILQRAHQIPERFWIDWQQKQMQNRIEELEYIKNNLTNPNDIDLSTKNRQKSLLLLHDKQHHMTLPRSTTLDRRVSTSSDNETSSSNTDDHSLFTFDQRSIDGLNDLNIPSPKNPITPKSQSTLDRSRLTIFLPFSHSNIPKQPVSINNSHQSVAKPTDIKINSVEVLSSASSIEDVAQIDTELNLTLILRENQDQTNLLLYSKAIINRTTAFRSLSK